VITADAPQKTLGEARRVVSQIKERADSLAAEALGPADSSLGTTCESSFGKSESSLAQLRKELGKMESHLGQLEKEAAKALEEGADEEGRSSPSGQHHDGLLFAGSDLVDGDSPSVLSNPLDRVEFPDVLPSDGEKYDDEEGRDDHSDEENDAEKIATTAAVAVAVALEKKTGGPPSCGEDLRSTTAADEIDAQNSGSFCG